MVTSPNFMLQASNAFMSFLLYFKSHALVSIVTLAMFTYPNPLLTKAEW
jgi:hypothetical protein